MIKRDLATVIVKKSKNYQVVSITGPRQSGKTTLVKDLFPDFLYVNLERPDTRSFAQNDSLAFLKQGTRMIIDEAQYVPSLFSYIQVLTDEDRNRRYVLTGSQHFLLLESITQSLAGRVVMFELYPLTISELKAGKVLPMSHDVAYVMQRGFYPRVIDRDLDPKDWYSGYVATYLERDVRSIKNVHNLQMFHKLLQLCASRVGGILNFDSLANDLGVSSSTVRSWIAVLETSHIIFLLQPYHKNLRKRLVKSPKLYFYDTGLICSLLGVGSVDQLKTHPLMGGIFENFIIADILKQISHSGLSNSFYFFRDKTGHEVDLILESDGKTQLFEIKLGSVFHDDFLNGMRYFEKISKLSPDKTIIYSGETQKRSDVSVINWRSVDKIIL